jgi:DNA-directed RNA polymerase beta subunit
LSVNSGDKVKAGDVLIEGMSIQNGELALGKDLIRGLYAMGWIQL